MSDENERPVASAGSVANAGTLRDTFAAAALTGLLSSLPNGDQYHPFAVEKAWSLADAMLCERERVANHPATPESSTLTDAEREAVEWADDFGREIACYLYGISVLRHGLTMPGDFIPCVSAALRAGFASGQIRLPETNERSVASRGA